MAQITPPISPVDHSVFDDSLAEAEPDIDLPAVDALPLDAILARFHANPGARGRPRRGNNQHTANGFGLLLTAAQHREHSERIAAKLTEAQGRLLALESRRGEVDVLDQALLDAYHAELSSAQDECKTIAAALATAQQKAAVAEAAEDERAFENRARQEQSENILKVVDLLSAMHECMTSVAGLGFGIAEVKEAISSLSVQAKARGRSDLAISFDEIRSTVAAELGNVTTPPSAAPERMGETDAEWSARLIDQVLRCAQGLRSGHKLSARRKNSAVERAEARARSRAQMMVVDRNEGESATGYEQRLWASVATFLKCEQEGGEQADVYATRLRNTLARELKITRRGESDAAYALRAANASASKQHSVDRADPLQDTGLKALRSIEAHAFPASAMTYVRQMQRLGREAIRQAKTEGEAKPKPQLEQVARFS
ncbi:hypothetical protein ACC827_26545 [Rhizobium ruizarguesonis]